MHATIDVRLTVSTDENKTISLATLAEFITDQNVESVLLEGLVESLDARSGLHNFCAFLGVKENQARQSLPILQPLLHDLAD